VIERLVTLVGDAPWPDLYPAKENASALTCCAASLLNAIVTAGNRHYGVSFSGTFPSDSEARALVASTGVPRALGLTATDAESLSTSLYRLAGFTGDRATRSSNCDAISGQLVDYLDECLTNTIAL
jgi:hypothetical protein